MKLVAVGDNCIDAYSNGENYPGGNPVNVAVYTTRLGGAASYVGVVGSDQNGKIMIDALKTKNVDISQVEVVEGKTAVTQVELKNGERIFGDYFEGVLENFKLSQSQREFIYSHDLVVSALWGNVHNEFKQFKENGVITAFDAATRPYDEAPTIALPYLDYFFYSSEKNKDDEDLRKEMKKFHSYGLKIVIVTFGEKGSMAYDGNDFIEYGIIPVDVVDTMGAGDSYIAGFLNGVLNNKPILECMEEGARAASETISYNGAWEY